MIEEMLEQLEWKRVLWVDVVILIFGGFLGFYLHEKINDQNPHPFVDSLVEANACGFLNDAGVEALDNLLALDGFTREESKDE